MDEADTTDAPRKPFVSRSKTANLLFEAIFMTSVCRIRYYYARILRFTGKEREKMQADILSKLKSSAESCYMCPLAETRKKAVFGEGPFDAPAMLVGEAPGADEDELGRPFIGRSGRLLSSLMEEAGLPREKLFITNMVKCRPPENRLPARQELEACRPYLLAQIAAIRPSLVLAVGNVPARAFLHTGEGITSLRGKFYTAESEAFSFMVRPVFHPSYLLRNRSAAEGKPISLTLTDLQEARKFLEKAIPGF